MGEALVSERVSIAEISDGIGAMQQKMGAAVDEHASLSRALADANARAAELANETERLQASLEIRSGRSDAVDTAEGLDNDDEFGNCRGENGSNSVGAVAATPEQLA